MVVHGDFLAQIVDAQTKEPFKEFTKDGKHYSEAEAGLDYLIKVQRLNATESSPKIRATFNVDGVDLGYATTDTFSEADFAGVYERVDGYGIMKSLKFEKPTLAQQTTDGGFDSDAPLGVMGTVHIFFHEAIDTGKIDTEDFSCSIPACEIEQSLSGNAKVIRSSEGSQVTKEWAPTNTQTSEGSLLESITINYCTALGLVKEGVLPKPGIWEYARMEAPSKRPLDPKLASIVPKKLKRKAEMVDGILVTEAKEWDLFDLSMLSDSEDEDEKENVDPLGENRPVITGSKDKEQEREDGDGTGKGSLDAPGHPPGHRGPAMTVSP